MRLEFVSRWDPSNNNNNNNGRRQGGSEKRKSSDEGRTHSCAPLKRPTSLNQGRKVRLCEMGLKYRRVVSLFSALTCNLNLLVGGILQIITIIIMAASKGGGPKRGNPAMDGRTHSCASLRRPTTLSSGEKKLIIQGSYQITNKERHFLTRGPNKSQMYNILSFRQKKATTNKKTIT